MNHKYRLATTSWDKAEYEAVQRVIESGMFTMGERVRTFEEHFARYIGRRYAVMVNSGSSANLLMTAALFYTDDDPLRPGDEVIVPAVAWSTTYFPFYQYGLSLRFVDIDAETLNYDLDRLASALNDRTRLIMAVNLLGNPNDFDRIVPLTAGRNIRLIEDNCEAMGAEFNGRKTGTFGVMASFSSFFSHHMSTMEGGLIVTDDEELYHIMLSLRAHGWTRDLPRVNRVTGTKSDDPFVESYRFVLPGYNVRPLELSGAIGIEQLKKLPVMVDRRRNNAAQFRRVLDGHPDIMIQKEIGKSSWFGFSMMIRRGSKLERRELMSRLEELGFEYRPIVAGNFARNDVMKYLKADIHGSLDNADHIHTHGLFIGNSQDAMGEAIGQLKRL